MDQPGFDAYVFMTGADAGSNPRQVKEDFSARPRVRFVAEFVGPTAIFGAVATETLGELQSLLPEYRAAGIRSEWVTTVKPSAIMAPKRGSPDYCAIVRAAPTADPFDVLDALDERFKGPSDDDPNHEHFVYGAAVVTGAWDLLIDLGKDSYAETMDLVRDIVRQVPGIGRTQTSVAYLPGNAIRPGS
jgi:hypothetical protein